MNEVARFWDENRRTVTLNPAFWMAHPLCRQAINRRIGGNPHEWTLDRFKRLRGNRVYERGISWGCGLGAFERAAVRMGMVREIDALDISPKSVEDARREAAKEELNVRFAIGDFNDPIIEPRRYDVVFFHQSLHHVARLERLFRRLARGLKPGAAIYLDEFTGPSRDRWTSSMLEPAQSVLDGLPDEIKLKKKLDFPVEERDPSEAIRSDEIQRFVREVFDVAEWKPYGGQIVDLVFPAISNEWANSAEGCRATLEMLRLEDEQLAADAASSHYVFAFGSLKTREGLALARIA